VAAHPEGPRRHRAHEGLQGRLRHRAGHEVGLGLGLRLGGGVHGAGGAHEGGGLRAAQVSLHEAASAEGRAALEHRRGHRRVGQHGGQQGAQRGHGAQEVAVDVEVVALQVHVGAELPGQRHEEALPQPEHAGALLEVDLEHGVLRHLEHVHREAHHHAERPGARAAQGPEQVCARVRIGRHLRAVCEHDVHGGDLVDGQAVEAALHALAAAREVSAGPHPRALPRVEGPLPAVPQVRVQLAQSDSGLEGGLLLAADGVVEDARHRVAVRQVD